ncbi:Acyl-CoA N-acyltransferase [Venustampulla echinocandica]|uniref:Acyl-CoA N-acyltransferase n=1 Tax=Venustampulla echinocandica TaxID=2656787 RepID=A0A370U2A8_9HELO|nr:Acyl-CoA N-acyltransferase [Venustampulla echinocandica]RDL41914.1 Acyl-CoA N-acyltransferase [Venustampulla echinocandica]
MSSPNPNFQLFPCTVADVPDMINIYMSAFADDYFARYTLPPDQIAPEEWQRWLTIRFTKVFSKPEYRVFKITDPNTGKACAFIRWAYPHVFTEEQKAQRKQEEKELERRKKEGTDDSWPRGANLEALDAKFSALDRIREETVDETNTYVAHLLAVHQDYQRRGLGPKLLKHTLDLADAEGRLVYIEATTAGYPVYAKLGFKEINAISVDLSKYGGKEPGVNRVMLREPQKVS